MIIATTQKDIRTAVHPITRWCIVYHLDLHTARLVGKWYVDWVLAGTTFLAQNAGAFVFSVRNFHQILSQLLKTKNACNLKSDRAPEFCGWNSEFLKSSKQKGLDLNYTEPYHKNQNVPIDVEIG